MHGHDDGELAFEADARQLWYNEVAVLDLNAEPGQYQP